MTRPPNRVIRRSYSGEIIVTLLNFSPSWREAMVRLVDAWGYAG
jgi:hypothetical protein